MECALSRRATRARLELVETQAGIHSNAAGETFIGDIRFPSFLVGVMAVL